jgi:beta-glucosidase/6-phospho-beta-glucosidase/beta-galactosidase
VQRRPRRYVTLEGYAVEGGLDGPYQPATCFLPTIALGRHVAPGDADDLWHDYEQVLDLVPTLGFDGVRLSVEWARVEPRRGLIDDAALARYVEVARYASSLGLGVTVVIVDAAWPAWLGLEAWLLPWVAPLVVAHTKRVVGSIDAANGVVVFAEPDRLVDGFVHSSAPPWRRSAHTDAAFARQQIASITATLREDPLVGPKIVASTNEVSAASDPSVLRAAFERDCDELYVRSLVAGHGPTKSAGLLIKSADGWKLREAASVDVWH